MLTIRRSDVPQYLRDGSFFESLDAQDDGVFDVPTDCFKDDASVESEPELVLLLQTVRFWGLFVMPLQICEYILENGQAENDERLLDSFPELAKYLECVLQAKESSVHDRIDAVIEAGLGISVVRMLHEKGYAWNETACASAAQMNDLECLMYLHTEGCSWNGDILSTAVESNSVSCLQYALDFGDFDADGMYESMITAALSGNIECMRLLQAAGATWDFLTVDTAICGNQLESVRYLHTQGCEISASVCCLAAMKTGDAKILRYLREVAGQSLFGVIAASAKSGNLDCMRYAHEQGVVWHVDVCMVAARGGHVNCLRYAHENGCPWDDETALAAISARQWGCLMYALRHGRGWKQHIVIAFVFYVAIPLHMKSYISPYTADWWTTKLAAYVLPFLIVLVIYRKHLGKYLSVRNVDRIVHSLFCLLCMFITCTLESEMEPLWVSVFKAVVFTAMVGLLVFVNVYHVVFRVVGEPFVIRI